MCFQAWFGYTITYPLGWIVSRAMVAGSLKLLRIYSLLLPYLRVFSQKVSYLTCPLFRYKCFAPNNLSSRSKCREYSAQGPLDGAWQCTPIVVRRLLTNRRGIFPLFPLQG